MFPMTATLHNQAQLNAFLAAMQIGAAPASLDVPTGPAAPLTEKAPVKETTSKKSAPKTQAESAPTQPIAEAVAVVASEPKQEALNEPETAPASPVPYADVIAAINSLAAAKGRNTAVELLSKFGVSKGPELKPEQYADFVATAAATAGA